MSCARFGGLTFSWFAGPSWSSTFVFSNSPDFSEPIKPDTVTQRYRRLAQRNGLRSTRFHALRHYSATELFSSGVDIRTVSGRLGHGTGATTLRLYAAWVNEADSRAADAIANVMLRRSTAWRLSARLGSSCGTEITAQDFERIRQENLRVQLTDFARLWLAAEQRADALNREGQGDWYLAGVQITCRWLAHATEVFNYPSGPCSRACQCADHTFSR